VRYTRTIPWRGSEADRKHLIIIVIFQVEKLCSALLMKIDPSRRVDLSDLLFLQEVKSPFVPALHESTLSFPMVFNIFRVKSNTNASIDVEVFIVVA
jgi:hypothetical protein